MRRRCRFLGATWVAMTVAITGLGCQPVPSPAREPSQLLRDYAAALRELDARKAWALLDDDAKRTQSFEAFEHWMLTNPAEATNLAEDLERPGGPVSVTTVIPIPGSPPVKLVTREGQTRIVASSLNLYSQATPALALRTFVRAIRLQRYEVLWRLMPESSRRKLTAQQLQTSVEGEARSRMASLARSIELSLPEGRLTVEARRAYLDLGAGASVVLHLEQGSWTIEDFAP